MNTDSTQYTLLDSGHGRKLEQVGPVRIDRQASLALWAPRLNQTHWKKAVASHIRSDKGGGHWKHFGKVPAQWQTRVGPFALHCKLTNFGHLGFFPEQLSEWFFLRDHVRIICSRLGRRPRILNLFGYTGCSSLALALGGAEVTHVDAAQGIVDWGKKNQKLNPEVPQDAIRWLVDDCLSFVQKEMRRGHTYDGVVIDPPSFGRGPRNQVFKIENDLVPLLEAIHKILAPRPELIHFSCHTPGFTPRIMENILRDCLKLEDFRIEHNEMVIESSEDPARSLPSGVCIKVLRG